MARIPDDVVDRIKKEVSLVDLIAAKGYELKKHGAKNVAICCPFHRDDKTPSLIITPEKNLFNCLACGASGSPIDWQMKIERVSFRHAVEQLKALLPGESSVYEQSESAVIEFTPLAANLAASGEHQKLMQHVIHFYHESLKQNKDALSYLEKRGLNNAELIETFKLGYGNRTLAYLLPPKRTADGDLIRGQLQEIGLLRDTGHEHFNGSIVVPIMDEHGVITEIYGRKVQGNRLRKGTAMHTYLPGPHAGVWNVQCLKATDEVILCEAIIDAMTFWVNGFRNVTASYGTGGFTDDHLHVFKANKIKRVYIAYDRDQAGNTAAETLAKKLIAEGFVCYRVLLPKGMDVNEYALQMTPVVKSLDLILRQAEWMGGVQAAEERETTEEVPAVEEVIAVAAKEKGIAEEKISAESSPPLAAKTAEDRRPRSNLEAIVTEHEIKITIGSRFYRIRGLQKNLSYDQLKVNLLVKNDDGLHVDTFDLYNAKQRAAFIKEAAHELNAGVEVIKEEVSQLFVKLEDLQDDLINDTFKKKDEEPMMTDDEREQALKLLRDPHLLDRILEDFEKAGAVGENTNKLVGYLACVSRKMKRPLAVMIQSTSAAGKSSLMDAVLNMMPAEERIQYSAMSGQSLYYMGEKDLKHKILAIAEEEGAQNASYALKLLQSEGKVTMASTGKNPITGNLETQDYEVEGPVSLFYTTTAIDLDEELVNRCLVLSVDESREQTRAIHAAQRHSHTIDGMLDELDKDELLKMHHNAQRLLQTLRVSNPYAYALTFLDDKTRTRRDHKKYLALIDAIALLHQYQRPRLNKSRNDKALDYIEVTLDDITLANRLANEVLGRTLDELPPQTRRLLDMITAKVQSDSKQQGLQQRDYRFTRKEIRYLSGWTDFQVKTHMQRLEEMEYLLVHSGGRGKSIVYELLYQGEGQEGDSFVMGLIDVAKLGYDVEKEPLNNKKEPSRSPQVAVKEPPSSTEKNTKNASYLGQNSKNTESMATMRYKEKNNSASHRTDIILSTPKYLMADSEV